VRTQAAVQVESAGDSATEIHEAAIAAADPRPALSWLDIGCGTGHVLRALRAYEPSRLVGIDILDWLEADLRDEVEMHVGPAERALVDAEPADRVLIVETMEHLEAPWSVLRTAAQRVRPGGIIVITTPNVANLRHRLELPVRGQLTNFRPDNTPHLSAILPHVAARILSEEGLTELPTTYAARDVIPFTGGRSWPPSAYRRSPRLCSISVVISARRA
jgi:2-polyprenyl-3-methyl-5-hydroxy-6-metoxy-1,4-benzoquinol methylase